MPEHRIPVAPGVALHAVDHPGERPPFLLVHGLASNLRLWDGVAAELAGRGHRVVAVDLRGHGRSTTPDDGYDVGTVAADLAVLVQELALHRPWVAGQSWGGNVALELAWGHASLVAGVACVDGGWIELADRFPDWDACRRALSPPRGWGTAVEVERYLRRAHPDWPESGIAGALACFEVSADGRARPWLTQERHELVLEGLWRHRPSTRYADVVVPVLLVPARREGAGPGGTADAVARAEAALPASRTVWIDGDHDLHAQHPDRVAAALVAAAQELP